MTWLGRILHQGCERTTTPGRALTGIVFGGLTGAGLTTLAWAGFMLAVGQPLMMAMGVLIFPYVLVVWVLGLATLGAPGWWVLHALGARCQQAAMIYGGGLTFVVIAALGPLYTSSRVDAAERWQAILLTAGLFALVGVAVAWVVARVAYEPAAKP